MKRMNNSSNWHDTHDTHAPAGVGRRRRHHERRLPRMDDLGCKTARSGFRFKNYPSSSSRSFEFQSVLELRTLIDYVDSRLETILDLAFLLSRLLVRRREGLLFETSRIDHGSLVVSISPGGEIISGTSTRRCNWRVVRRRVLVDVFIVAPSLLLVFYCYQPESNDEVVKVSVVTASRLSPLLSGPKGPVQLSSHSYR
jgi:hypothetical protein